MCRNFIKKKNGSFATRVGDQIGVRQHDPQQQCLLFTGGALRGGLILGCVRDQQILPVRSGKRSTCGGVTAAPAAQIGRKIVPIPTRKRERCAGKYAVGRVRGLPIECIDKGGAGGANRRAMLGHGLFKRAQPVGIGVGVCKQAVALAHRRFISCALHRMSGFQGDDETVEETTSITRRVDEKPVLSRR